MCSFTAGGLAVDIDDSSICITNEGITKKFVNSVQQITFSAEQALKNERNVLYITERAVFKLIEGGLKLIEIAPGVDLDKDILNQMEFAPIISDNLKQMDCRIFSNCKMNIA